MPDPNSKQKIIRALASNSDLAAAACLPPVGSKDGTRLLQWLDHSGLALHFLNWADTHSKEACLPDPWRDALDGRRRRNAARQQDMLEEFRRLNTAFHTNGIKVITLKGFSLVPDFCQDPGLRHQTDFDFLVGPGDADAAAQVLRSHGYATPELSYSGESFFSTPLRRVPSGTDDLYALQHHRQVDLHVSLTESSPWLPLDFPGGDHTPVPMNLAGIDFYGLSLELRFLTQVLHAFRHSFRSWLRLSWLLEIGYCMEIHHADDSLWAGLLEQAGNTLLMKRVFAFILTLTHRLFGSRIPDLLAGWTAEAMTPTMLLWLERFSGGWALADWPGNLNNLFLAPEFIPDSRLRREYLRSRLIPKRERLSIETRTANDLERPFRWRINQWKYVAHRAGVHLADLARFPLVQWRWQRALGSARTELNQAHS
jgi:putative nucleotidyltransferase-like protein